MPREAGWGMAFLREKKKEDGTVQNRRPVKKMTTVSLSVRIFLTLIVTFAIIFFATKMMENNKLKKERAALQEQIDEAKQKVSDLQYEVDAPVDDQYVEDWGKDNGYEYPDATVYIPNS